MNFGKNNTLPNQLYLIQFIALYPYFLLGGITSSVRCGDPISGSVGSMSNHHPYIAEELWDVGALHGSVEYGCMQEFEEQETSSLVELQQLTELLSELHMAPPMT
jgi:hypothetical protein